MLRGCMAERVTAPPFPLPPLLPFSPGTVWAFHPHQPLFYHVAAFIRSLGALTPLC